jgi:hypothetical protein
MKQKTLHIKLIHQDLKHSQLVYGLEKIDLAGSDVHLLALLEIVAELMQVPPGKVDEDWGDLYTELMKGAIRFETTSKGEALQPYAKQCYAQLNALLDGLKLCD